LLLGELGWSLEAQVDRSLSNTDPAITQAAVGMLADPQAESPVRDSQHVEGELGPNVEGGEAPDPKNARDASPAGN